MTEDQLDLLQQAQEDLQVAKYLLSGGYLRHAASRAYYCMFYVVQAFLEGEGKSYSKHSGVISAFGRYFAHSGKVPLEFHRYLLDAEDLRRKGNYTREAVTEQQAKEQISHAEEFLALAERLIGPISED